MNVFIGGSRAVSNLDTAVRERLDDLVKRGCRLFIGDANGADKAVQTYLAQQHYPNVVVFCMKHCRNNVGRWPTRKIDSPNAQNDFSYYAAKDVVMSQQAQCGLMLWDGKSKGTPQNMLNLIAAHKRNLGVFCANERFSCPSVCKRFLPVAKSVILTPRRVAFD
jgi:adenine-specific DNA-methyltransferase